MLYALRPRASVESKAPKIVANAKIARLEQADVLLINDNNGEDFTFQKLKHHEVWFVKSAADRAKDMLKESDSSMELPQVDTAAAQEIRALASRKVTDMLTVEMAQLPLGMHLDPTTTSGRAAWYSLGFLLRRAMTTQLDIAESEIDLTLQPLFYETNTRRSARLLLSDRLDNGAGYSIQFAGEDDWKDLLSLICDHSSSFAAPLVDGRHADSCASSCHACLRDFNNLPYHPLLDWRIGMDMARLLHDPTAAVSLEEDHWVRLAEKMARTQFSSHRSTVERVAGFWAGTDEHGTVKLMTHPLWEIGQAEKTSAGQGSTLFEPYHPALAEATNEVEARGLHPKLTSIFDMVRFPFL